MKDIPIKAKVACSDGHAGSVTAVIFNPVSKELTHIVVKVKHAGDHLVPLDLVVDTDEKSVTLFCSKEVLAGLPTFTEKHFIPVPVGEAASYPGGEYISPYVAPINPMSRPIDEEEVPPGELVIHRGADIEALDGHVGVLGEFILDPESGHVTHMIMQKGHLWGKHDIAIPMSAIGRTEQDTVFLNIDKEAVKALPTIDVKRKYS